MKPERSPRQKLLTLNRKHARMRWANLLNQVHLSTLKELSMQFGFSVAMGDVMLLEGRWYVTHTGLIRLARHNRCAGIHVRPVPEFSDPSAHRWAFEAKVYKSKMCKGFVGYGDADPSNVSALVRGAEMRVAETRAVNRALRKAYGIGICSVEEIGTNPGIGEKLPRGTRTAMGTALAPRFVTASARSSASTSSTPNLSRRMPSTSAERRLSEKPPASRLRISSSNWPSGPRRTAMPCSASSTAISARKKVPHETSNRRLARRGSLCRRPNPRRTLPRSGATSPFSSASAKTLLHGQPGHP